VAHEWMSAELRQEIEDLRITHGFDDEQEAIAYWHLFEARRLMTRFAQANWERLDDRQEAVRFTARFKAQVVQHFDALAGVLGRRVLRRDYEEGWGREPSRPEA
jgi:hypothetical protein